MSAAIEWHGRWPATNSTTDSEPGFMILLETEKFRPLALHQPNNHSITVNYNWGSVYKERSMAEWSQPAWYQSIWAGGGLFDATTSLACQLELDALWGNYGPLRALHIQMVKTHVYIFYRTKLSRHIAKIKVRSSYLQSDPTRTQVLSVVSPAMYHWAINPSQWMYLFQKHIPRFSLAVFSSTFTLTYWLAAKPARPNASMLNISAVATHM